MFLSGDEICRTQQGNNNAYCQDNEISWFDWDLASEQEAMSSVSSGQMIALRRRQRNLQRRGFLSGALNRRGMPDIQWHGLELNQPDWDALMHACSPTHLRQTTTGSRRKPTCT